MSEEELKVPDELFKDVKFYIVGDIEQKVVQLLKAGKGKEVSYNALATHIIAEDGDNPEVGESREVFDLPVVKPSWVILSVRCGDLLPVTGFSPESGQLFFGVRACLPHVNLSALWAFVTFYGGDCQLNFNKKCTHLVVPEPKGTKYECALRHSSIKIVTPEWILDSVKEKNRKDEALYHPRLTYHKEEEEEEEGSEDERSSRSEGSYSDRRSPRSRRSSPASSRETSPARRRRSPSPKPERRPELMFDDSDDSSPEKEERNLNWTPADVPQPSTAKLRLQPAKDTGLINLCANVPPVPGGGGPPDARLGGGGPGAPLGAERPEMMGGWNTVARPLRNITNSGEPQQVNRPPNVTHVRQTCNDNSHKHAAIFILPFKSYSRYKVLARGQRDVCDCSYCNVLYSVPDDGFLVGCVFAIADYPEQMADKQLLATWKRIIQTYGGSVDSALNRCTHLLCESQVSSMYLQALREGKRCVTAHWLNTVLKKKKMVPPHRTLHLPFSFPPGAKPCSQHIISVTGFLDSDRDDLKLMAYLAGARYTGYLCRSNTVLICKEPSGLKFEKAKEWRIPCVNAQWLCDILLGNFEALRQVQHSRYSQFNLTEPLAPNPHLVQNLLLAWRTPVKVSPEALVSKLWDTAGSEHDRVLCSSCRTEELPQPTKKLPAELTPYVFFTGFEPLQTQQHTKKLYELGGEVADSAQKCTHLVASKVTRTVKFLTAISVVKHIVTPEWLQESWKSQKFVDEQNYMLHDAEAEVLFDFSLEESLKRAHATPLFKGKYFYITPGICPGLGTMKAIVESAGGKLLPKQPSFRKIMEHKQNKNLPEIVLISCDNDLHLCREYFLKSIDVHNAEFILTGVLTQTLDYESYPLH
uniref:PAX-interacting protein 1 n=1 Tax=Electrophorus electricus TaxID=8005 RepID=A0A4W4DRW1_ELEEL